MLKTFVMKLKERSLLPLFEQFLQDNAKGRRLKADGSRIKPQTVKNYGYVLKLLQEFETDQNVSLRVLTNPGKNKRIVLAEKKYWKKFYTSFTDFLYIKKKCFDNYVGNVIKVIRIFFNYLNRELSIITGEFYKSFYVKKEEVPIITLLPAQLQVLINDQNFTENLTASLQKSKDIFVFGCTVALRVSDLFNVKFRDIQKLETSYYLALKTIKTGTEVRIKLPDYAINIVDRFKQNAKGRATIFPPIPRTRFNEHVKQITELAGWCQELGKSRSKRGKSIEQFNGANKTQYRFCDLVSSHTMRRTAITTMLMLGMKEHIVRQISGHSQGSKSFYRYVHIVQSYLDNEVDMVFNALSNRRVS